MFSKEAALELVNQQWIIEGEKHLEQIRLDVSDMVDEINNKTWIENLLDVVLKRSKISIPYFNLTTVDAVFRHYPKLKTGKSYLWQKWCAIFISSDNMHKFTLQHLLDIQEKIALHCNDGSNYSFTTQEQTLLFEALSNHYQEIQTFIQPNSAGL